MPSSVRRQISSRFALLNVYNQRMQSYAAQSAWGTYARTRSSCSGSRNRMRSAWRTLVGLWTGATYDMVGGNSGSQGAIPQVKKKNQGFSSPGELLKVPHALIESG